ncbi:putative UPF0481 protein At3g02645 [Lactuca sativa]|uniref:Uncharacterized protein n=1 Tax=Lactuca sativa TaxID=4236 RepID=A0A9R1V5L9_LACSA|nr:putative UPF0481 protein At3g02645 [Lactuca sativa]KAJ0198660.1 hypothetical protein LSAT_V11C600325030 [Lactuca sativa]
METSSRNFSNSSSFNKSNIDQEGWVKSMRKSIAEPDNEEISKFPVCIFSVPKVLLATDPDSYIPQQVALGPFHHWREEVYDMQRYKLEAARRTQKLMNTSFEEMVEEMRKQDEARIRACYHKFLDMSGEVLVWILAVDMAFLLEFLRVYSVKEQARSSVENCTSSVSHLVDTSGSSKMSQMAILRDLVMVENQIPLFLMKTMVENQIRDDENKSAAETLKSMLMGLYHEVSPFKEKQLPDIDIDDCDHLLDFLYHMTVPNNKELHIEAIEIDYEGITEDANDGDQEESFAKPSDVQHFKDFIWKIVSKSNASLLRIFKKLIFMKPVTVMMKLPLKVLSNIPMLNLIKEPVEKMIQNIRGGGEEKSKDDKDSNVPLIEEIKIPSVTQMATAGILFSPVNDGIFGISFDIKTSTLYLPVVILDVHTEVYLRNLVAYEACVAAGPLVVARYTELMNGIIDTEEDAKLLSERGIVQNHLKSDKEVADLWNGMSKSVKLTKVPKMDKVIEDVNKRYSKTWRVKLSRFMKKYVFASWKLLTLLAGMSMLFLTTIQAVCSVYSCARVFNKLPEIPEGTAE